MATAEAPVVEHPVADTPIEPAEPNPMPEPLPGSPPSPAPEPLPGDPAPLRYYELVLD